MKTRIRTLGAVLTAAALLAAGVLQTVSGVQGDSTQPIGPVELSARVIEWLEADIILTGGSPRARSLDGRYDFHGTKVVVTLNKGKNIPRKDLVARVVASGGTTVDARLPDRTVHVTATKAIYDHASETVVFDGNVSARVTDPQLAEPSLLSGQKVTLWLNAGPGETRVKVEGAPASIQVTPKDQKTAGKKS